MSSADTRIDDTVSIRLAAQLPCTLLLVGSNTEVASRANALRELGMEIIAVETMADALVRQEAEACSIILTASRLSDGSGAELVEAIRAHSGAAYVYAIIQLNQGGDGRGDADDWIEADASAGEFLARLRAARRIVTLERVARLEHRASRRDALVDQVSGAFSKSYFYSRGARNIAQTRPGDQPIAVLVVQAAAALGDEQLGNVVNVLYSSVRSESDLVARLSATSFALLLNDAGARAAYLAKHRIAEMLAELCGDSRGSFPWVDLRCGIAVAALSSHAPLELLQSLVEGALRSAGPLEPRRAIRRGRTHVDGG